MRPCSNVPTHPWHEVARPLACFPSAKRAQPAPAISCTSNTYQSVPGTPGQACRSQSIQSSTGGGKVRQARRKGQGGDAVQLDSEVQVTPAVQVPPGGQEEGAERQQAQGSRSRARSGTSKRGATTPADSSTSAQSRKPRNRDSGTQRYKRRSGTSPSTSAASDQAHAPGLARALTAQICAQQTISGLLGIVQQSGVEQLNATHAAAAAVRVARLLAHPGTRGTDPAPATPAVVPGSATQSQVEASTPATHSSVAGPAGSATGRLTAAAAAAAAAAGSPPSHRTPEQHTHTHQAVQPHPHAPQAGVQGSDSTATMSSLVHLLTQLLERSVPDMSAREVANVMWALAKIATTTSTAGAVYLTTPGASPSSSSSSSSNDGSESGHVHGAESPFTSHASQEGTETGTAAGAAAMQMGTPLQLRLQPLLEQRACELTHTLTLPDLANMATAWVTLCTTNDGTAKRSAHSSEPHQGLAPMVFRQQVRVLRNTAKEFLLDHGQILLQCLASQQAAAAAETGMPGGAEGAGGAPLQQQEAEGAARAGEVNMPTGRESRQRASHSSDLQQHAHIGSSSTTITKQAASSVAATPHDTARNLSIILHAVAKLRLHPPPAWRAAFLSVWLAAVQEAGSQALSMVLWAFARLGWTLSSVHLEVMQARATQLMPHMGSQAAANTLWALGKLRARQQHRGPHTSGLPLLPKGGTLMAAASKHAHSSHWLGIAGDSGVALSEGGEDSQGGDLGSRIGRADSSSGASSASATAAAGNGPSHGSTTSSSSAQNSDGSIIIPVAEPLHALQVLQAAGLSGQHLLDTTLEQLLSILGLPGFKPSHDELSLVSSQLQQSTRSGAVQGFRTQGSSTQQYTGAVMDGTVSIRSSTGSLSTARLGAQEATTRSQPPARHPDSYAAAQALGGAHGVSGGNVASCLGIRALVTILWSLSRMMHVRTSKAWLARFWGVLHASAMSPWLATAPESGESNTTSTLPSPATSTRNQMPSSASGATTEAGTSTTPVSGASARASSSATTQQTSVSTSLRGSDLIVSQEEVSGIASGTRGTAISSTAVQAGSMATVSSSPHEGPQRLSGSVMTVRDVAQLLQACLTLGAWPPAHVISDVLLASITVVPLRQQAVQRGLPQLAADCAAALHWAAILQLQPPSAFIDAVCGVAAEAAVQTLEQYKHHVQHHSSNSHSRRHGQQQVQGSGSGLQQDSIATSQQPPDKVHPKLKHPFLRTRDLARVLAALSALQYMPSGGTATGIPAGRGTSSTRTPPVTAPDLASSGTPLGQLLAAAVTQPFLSEMSLSQLADVTFAAAQLQPAAVQGHWLKKVAARVREVTAGLQEGTAVTPSVSDPGSKGLQTGASPGAAAMTAGAGPAASKPKAAAPGSARTTSGVSTGSRLGDAAGRDSKSGAAGQAGPSAGSVSRAGSRTEGQGSQSGSNLSTVRNQTPNAHEGHHPHKHAVVSFKQAVTLLKQELGPQGGVQALEQSLTGLTSKLTS